MLKRQIYSLVLTIPLLLVGESLILHPDHAYAYVNYDDCVSRRSVELAPDGGLSDSALTDIETSCHTEFAGQNTSNSSFESTVRGVRPTASSPATRSLTLPSSQTSTTSSTTPSPSSSSSPTSTITPSTSSTPSPQDSASPSTTPSAESSSESQPAADRPYGGFINDSRGLPTLDPQQYINYYQGTSFSRLTSSRDAFGYLVSFAISFMGMVAIIFLIYAGFVYITANGEQAKIDKAKKLIWGTLIGMLIVFSVYAVVATALNISAAINPGVNIGPLNVGPGGTTLQIP